jgi:hypothetical protein
MTDYQKQAQDFLKKTHTDLKVKFLETAKYFDDDKEERDIYRVTVRRVPQGAAYKKSFSFKFGQSINCSKTGEEPTAYDVLTCLTKYDPGTFENFCGEYGYDTDSRKAEKVYKAVVKEFAGVNRLFSDVIEDLAEIQ